MMDQVSLAYWFPILAATGVKVPRTEFWHTDADFWPLVDGKGSPSADGFLQDLLIRASKWDFPIFLRTGHTSSKHSWKETCFVAKPSDLSRHVYQLIEDSLMPIFPLALDTWVIREFLDLDVRFTAFWGDLPIAQERRYFIRDGKIACSHPYWPAEAFRDWTNDTDWQEPLAKMNTEEAPELESLTLKVAPHFAGWWSLDWARHKDGSWYAIDMAPGTVSWHWPDCPANLRQDLVPAERE